MKNIRSHNPNSDSLTLHLYSTGISSTEHGVRTTKEYVRQGVDVGIV